MTLSVNDVEASGFLNARFGADHGNPVAGNPFSIYFNPAAITNAKGTQLVLDNAFVYRIASYDRSPSALSPSNSQDPASPGYVNSNTGKATIGNFLALPFVGLTTDAIAPNLTVGVASYVPFGGIANWGKNDAFAPGSPGSISAPGGYDGQVRWHSISGSIIALYNSVAVAYKLPDYGLSFGVNASLIYHQLETIRARNVNGSDDVGEPGAPLEGRSLLSASGLNASVAAGVLWEPTRDLRIGASYTSRPSFGQMRLKGELDVQLPSLLQQNNVDVTQTYPDVIRFGVGYNVTPDLELRADLEYVRWSAFKRQCVLNRDLSYKVDCNIYDNGASVYAAERGEQFAIIQVIPRNWRDAGSLRVGAGYKLTEETELFGSLTGDTAASPASTMDATFIDAFKLVGTLGARHFFTEKFALAGSYNHVYFFERSTSSSALYSNYVQPTNSPSANGTYNQQVMFLNVNASFYF